MMVEERAVQAVKVGLVLSGGGAKGAYQVGVIRALAESGIKVDMVAGASIGALNGAIVASADTLHIAAQHLEELWRELIASTPIRVSNKLAVVPFLLYGYGMNPRLFSSLQVAIKLLKEWGVDVPDPTIDEVLDSSRVERLLQSYLNPELLRKGLPVWVSLYESAGGIDDLFCVLKAAINLGNTEASTYLHLQALADEQMREALLASAALPLLYKNRKVGGQRYSDGGQGDWATESGNTPIKPLIDQGCNLIFASLLSDGSFWERPKDSNITVVELRPRQAISRGITDLMGFDKERIESWMKQGYDDTQETLLAMAKRIDVLNQWQASERDLDLSDAAHSESDAVLESAMTRLRRTKNLPSI